MGNFSPVNRDENSRNKTKMVKYKLASFATVVALWTLLTLLIKLIRMLLKWKYIDCKNYAILAASFVLVTRSGVFIWEIFIPVTEISVAKTEISVTGPAQPLI